MNHESFGKHERGEGAAHRDGSPYLWGCLFWVGMSVPAHPPWALGRACAKGMEEAKTMSSFFALEKATIVR